MSTLFKIIVTIIFWFSPFFLLIISKFPLIFIIDNLKPFQAVSLYLFIALTNIAWAILCWVSSSAIEEEIGIDYYWRMRRERKFQNNKTDYL